MPKANKFHTVIISKKVKNKAKCKALVIITCEERILREMNRQMIIWNRWGLTASQTSYKTDKKCQLDNKCSQMVIMISFIEKAV